MMGINDAGSADIISSDNNVSHVIDRKKICKIPKNRRI